LAVDSSTGSAEVEILKLVTRNENGYGVEGVSTGAPHAPRLNASVHITTGTSAICKFGVTRLVLGCLSGMTSYTPSL